MARRGLGLALASVFVLTMIGCRDAREEPKHMPNDVHWQR